MITILRMRIKKPTLLLPIFLSICFFVVSCGVMPLTPETSTEDIPVFVLASADEPGQRLMLKGTVVDSQTNEPIPDTKIHLYHADANGEYQPTDPNDESTARLSGTLTTDTAGNFAVDTIVPREYDQPGNRHIHLHSVSAANYQNGGGVILFENDVNPEIRQWANETGFGTIIELEEIDGVQHGHVTISLDPIE